jgi:FAD/FMN-containing dehydrogenase
MAREAGSLDRGAPNWRVFRALQPLTSQEYRVEVGTSEVGVGGAAAGGTGGARGVAEQEVPT